jgi:hypothetical protein
MMGWSLRKTLGYYADGSQSVDKYGRRNSFYGPIRRGELPAAIRKLEANPKLRAKFDAHTDAALRGSHKIGGFTDQGLPTDPNGTVTRRRKGLPALPTVNFGGNEFTEWGGTKRSRDYRLKIEKGIAGSGDSPIKSVPTPADAIKNVPESNGAITNSLLQRNNSAILGSSRGGPVAININGNSHDPEALATLVQRRVDEQMNWRTHDTESEYT